ncbi:hypothetical protein DXG01_009689 [Tephrocybe rancida]|nr:hypothetical protein DXG01_009689 [Tephrocybe rancida]
MSKVPLGGGFQRIGKGIYLSSSKANATGSSTNLRLNRPPTLIITFGWMGAKLPHLMKYTAVYYDLYPEATHILIQCEPSFFISRERTRQTNLEPVIDVLKSLGYLPATTAKPDVVDIPADLEPHLLIHAFSNGGCSQLTCLSRLLRARYPNWDLMKPGICAIVLDSCPGLGTVQHARRAMGTLVGSPLLRPLLSAIITWLFFYSAVMKRLFGAKNPLEALKYDLNRPNLLPWTRKSTPRLYLASRKDEVVAFYEVEGHAQDAKAAGFEDVRFEVFEDTPHVSHAKFEPERYWGAVEAAWDAAVDAGRQ